ncbi:hypothetical protein FLL45_00650 [Aliikangiella marina]|uniref:VOC domain-containing protein n=1 Tax=Aliikangiella marina TaxID=1712262 RepID=A0A545TH22_9GAMM|nr:hypothetical protein [Aliikangiella marina]TQV76505.1 hypothetical protein FLL45_00650 [Aliikangiella marina]
MELLGIRFCSVNNQAEKEIDFFENGLGLKNSFKDMQDVEGMEGFFGGIFSTKDGASWAEIWPSGEQMPAGLMLQLVVDNADSLAQHAEKQGLDPQGPVDAHGERIYYIQSPSGLNMSFQSKLEP